jgi:2-oxoglutarate ferredoxin oxidoreductase subunit gamma
MREDIFIAGFGGQGVILTGRIICLAAMEEGRFVSHIPSYGAEVRGGTANCSVVLSDESIASPLVSRPTVCLVFNTPSLLKFQGIVREGGLLLWNRSLIDVEPQAPGVELVAVRANETAEKAGSYRAANMVALGALLRHRPSLVSLHAVLAVLEEAVSSRNKSMGEVNRRALQAGYDGEGE